MAFKNNTMIVRHRLLSELVKLWRQDALIEKIDRLPIELSPKKSAHFGRCCVHKERAVWRYKSLPLLGLDMTDETDELTPLSEYARQALSRHAEGRSIKDNIMCVIDEACSSCVHINYEITNLCRGCMARNCMHNCPKDAVELASDGKAYINHDKCISCGICHRSCPYHAIVHIPVPCEEACPIKCISKNENGIQQIDESKCIYCGKCLNACPFGAIFEISQAFDVLEAIRRGEQVVAIVAPAVLGQYDAAPEQVYGAIRAMGFHDVIEVAKGAMTTTTKEAHELLEKIEEGQAFMTTSCCPSYIQLVEKHIPNLQPFVSTTRSPMYYTARMAKEQYPECKTVFFGPCIAKRMEGRRDEAVDYVMTFEELGALFQGFELDLPAAAAHKPDEESVREAHGFAKAGGVTAAVQSFLKLTPEQVKTLQLANLDTKNIALLKSYARTGQAPAQFIEVMACEGGCITGPGSGTTIVDGKRRFDRELAKQQKTY